MAEPDPTGSDERAVVRRRFEEIAAERGIDRPAQLQLEQLLQVVANDRHAPTAVRDLARAVDLHIADSLAALDLPVVTSARVIADIGAGAGFPGLPLAIALPGASVRLLDSSTRACEFLRRAIRATGIAGAEVVHQRAEAWPEGRAVHDLAVARAVGPLPVVLEYAAPLLRVGGSAVVWRGARRPEEERWGERAARVLGLGPGEIHPTRPYPGARSHHLHLYLKVEGTPGRFPRRPGLAAKRPLGR